MSGWFKGCFGLYGLILYMFPLPLKSVDLATSGNDQTVRFMRVYESVVFTFLTLRLSKTCRYSEAGFSVSEVVALRFFSFVL